MKAVLDWAGCATFRLTLDDSVVFLDAFLERSTEAVPTGISADTVEEADWILVGHSHADHAWGAERIAMRTGATIVGSYETVRVMAALGVPESQLVYVSGGEKVRLGRDAMVSVFPSMHSCVWTEKSTGDSGTPCLGDLGLDWFERRNGGAARLGDLQKQVDNVAGLKEFAAAHKALGCRGDGGPLVYLIETPEGSLLYQDTSGYWTGLYEHLQPDVAILAAAGRGNVDGEPVQGSLADFIGDQVDLLGPDRLIFSHHDDWMPGWTNPVDLGPIGKVLGERAPKTEIIELGYMSAYPLFG